jgi:asparagine synthase (glutamine-hydrolysing)
MGVSEGRDAILGAASQAGVRTILTGDIADSCVGGSPLVFDSLLRQGKLRALPRYLRAYRQLSPDSLRKTIAFGCLAPLLPLPAQAALMAAYTQRDVRRHAGWLLPGWMPEALRADLLRRHLRLCLATERGRRFANPTREAEYRMLYAPEISRHPVPWSLEFWRPFADRRLHEFLLAIPPEQKFTPLAADDPLYAGSKWLVRRALRGILPERIRTRTTKTVFNAVYENEVERHWPLYVEAFGPAARPEIAARGYVDQARFWARLEALRRGEQGGDYLYVKQLVGLETWLRTLRLPRPQLVTVPPPWPTHRLPRETARGPLATSSHR